MLLLASTTDKLQLVTSASTAVDVVATYMDASTASPPVVGGSTSGRKLSAVSTPSTADIVDAPGASTLRTLRTCSIRNKDTATSNDVTVRYNANGTTYEIVKATLKAGETLEYASELGWRVVGSPSTSVVNASTAQQGAGFSSDTYLTGSNVLIPTGAPVVGTTYNLRFDVVKTNVGTATPIVIVRIGTASTTSDTARLTFTFGAGTTAADTAAVEITAMFRSVGSGTSAVLQGQARAVTNLTTTGWSNAVKALQVTSSGFDSSALGGSNYIGASYNGGGSASHTVQLVRAEIIP